MKNIGLEIFPGWGKKRNLLLIMKLTFILLVACFMQVSASVYSQSTKLNLNVKNERVEDVLREIEAKSDFRFFYQREQVNVERKVNFKVTEESVEQILQRLFDNQNVTFDVREDNLILIKTANSIEYGSSTSASEELKFQQQKITGKVTDSQGQPLPGVTVLVKGTSNGTVTNIDGNYVLNGVSDEIALTFSFVGMKTVEVPLAGKTVVNVTMEDETIGIDEVVAIGYGTVKKSDLTGAVAKVTSEDLTLGGTVSNAAQALQGRTSGVQVIQNSKAPGGSISVRVRGANSISSSNDPLYVVDGFPTSNGTDINPNDIESMEILKDASATAIYGARGANGVILITTKRGKKGENQISYSGHVGAQKVVNPFHMLNGKDYMNLANALYKEIEGQENQEYAVYTQSQLQSDVNTNWIDETSRLGIVQDHNIQFKGGSDKTQVLSSLGYFKQNGVLKNTDFERLSGRVNIDQRVNDFIKVGSSIMAQRENSNFQKYAGNILNENILYSVLTYDPTVEPYNADGSYGATPGGIGDNPLANLLERNNDMVSDKFNGTANLEITPIEGLVAKVRGGAETVHNFKGTYLPRSTYQGGIDDGVASTYDYASTHALMDAFVNYSKDIAEVHSFNVMGGYSYEKSSSESRSMKAKGFSTDLYGYNNMGAASTITDYDSYKGENLLISYFGRVNYSFKNKYLLTFTIRRDGSSRFGEDSQWGTFPSGSFAWRMSDEPFIKDLGLFSSLKFRAGYGKTGNDQIGNYARYALVSNVHVTFDGTDNTSGTHLNPTTPDNPSLKWETTSQYNAGLDMGFLSNRITATADVYYKKTTDLLVNKTMPSYSGFYSGQSNVGSIENKGIEFEIDSKNTTGQIKWDTRFNIAFNKNEVLDIDGTDIYITSARPYGEVSPEAYAVIREGEALGSLFGYVYEGVIQEGETYKPQPNAKPGDPKFKDVSGDGEITPDDRTIIGSASPDFIFGLTNNFSYKNFDLSVFIHGSVGNDLMNMTDINLEWKHTSDALNRWTTDNTTTDVPRNGFYYSEYGGYFNTHFIENASFVRLKNVTLGYTIPAKLKFMQSCRVYASAENLFTLTKYSGWDPEVDTKAYENDGSGQTANAGAGLDFNSYPSMRTFTFGIDITF